MRCLSLFFLRAPIKQSRVLAVDELQVKVRIESVFFGFVSEKKLAATQQLRVPLALIWRRPQAVYFFSSSVRSPTQTTMELVAPVFPQHVSAVQKSSSGRVAE